MGNCAGKGSDPGLLELSEKNRQIEAQLRKDKKALQQEIKLLLLGAGESGKSTIARQMKILYLKGFTPAEREIFREVIFSNVILSMRAIVLAAENFGIDFLSENNQCARIFKANSILFEQQFTPEIVMATEALWADPGRKAIMMRSDEFQLNDTAEYFLSQVKRLAARDYIPSEQDILYSRSRTSGIIETVFNLGGTTFRMVDVGGQRSERKKWIHCFQDVVGLIFCVAISEYDQKLYEDGSVNRMHESIKLFDEICNCDWFTTTSIILFLNKADLFRKKISHIYLNIYFPYYTQGCDYNKATLWLTDKFKSLSRNNSKHIYTHITIGTDTDNIRFVFAAVREIVLKESFMVGGI